MKSRTLLLCLCAALLLAGCSTQTNTDGPDTKEASIKANLDKLPAEDRQAALEQRFCAVESENRLGTMGMPVKVMVKDQPVFLCCKSCKSTALKDPEKTLAHVKELKEKAKK